MKTEMITRESERYYTSHAQSYWRCTTVLFKQIAEYLRFVARRLVEDRCLTVAGSLTYTTLLALVPIFTVTVTLTAHVPAVKQLVEQVRTFILKNLLPEVAGRVITVYMEQFAQNAARLTLIGLAIILATAIALMFTIDSAFNDIWRTRQQRSWWARLVAYTALISIGPLLIGASLTITSFVVHLAHKLERVLPLFDDILLRVIPFAMTTIALVLAYRIVPNRHVPARHAIAGGLFAALLFELTKYLFVVYLAKVPTYSLIYGTFAAIPIFLLWLFCCWMVVLVGAEVTATFSYFRHMDAQRADEEFRIERARRIVQALTPDGAQAAPQLGFGELRLRVPMPIDLAEDTLAHLIRGGIVETVGTRSAKLFRLAPCVPADLDLSDAALKQMLRGGAPVTS
jgi:membrane protein